MALLSLFKNRDCNKLVLEESNQETELRVDIASLTMADLGIFIQKVFETNLNLRTTFKIDMTKVHLLF